MAESNQKRAVGLFAQRERAEQALKELKASGFSMDNVSIVAKDADENSQLGGAQASDQVGNQDIETATSVVADAATTATWGTVLVGLTSLAIPGIGPLIAAGSLGAALVTNLGGLAIGTAAAGGLVNALTDIGIPEEQARHFSDRLHLGNYLLILDGTEDEISSAEGIFSNSGIQDWSVFDTPAHA